MTSPPRAKPSIPPSIHFLTFVSGRRIRRYPFPPFRFLSPGEAPLRQEKFCRNSSGGISSHPIPTPPPRLLNLSRTNLFPPLSIYTLPPLPSLFLASPPSLFFFFRMQASAVSANESQPPPDLILAASYYGSFSRNSSPHMTVIPSFRAEHKFFFLKLSVTYNKVLLFSSPPEPFLSIKNFPVGRGSPSSFFFPC